LGISGFFLLHWAATDMTCFDALLKAQLALGSFKSYLWKNGLPIFCII